MRKRAVMTAAASSRDFQADCFCNDQRGRTMAEMKIGSDIFNIEIDGPVDAPAVLMSNSLGTDLHMWDGQVPALAKKFRVIRYDSRGHGGSTANDGPYSIAQLGQDAINILDALDIAKAHFIGLSLGGMVGMWLLTHHGARIDRAVLANTGAFMGNPDFWNMRIRTARTQGMEALVAGTVERWFTREFAERAPEKVATVAAMVQATPAVGYASSCAAIRDMDQREAIRSITRPVLVIVGARDPATPPAMGGLIASSIPGARLIDLEAAHLSAIEAETAFTRAVASFLSAPAKVTAARKAAPARKTAPARKAAPAKKKTAPASKAGPAKKKAAPARKAAAGKPAAKKTTARKAAVKKSPGKKSASRPSPGKAAKKTVRKAVRKAVRKTVKKTATRAAKKAAGKRPAPRTSAVKKKAIKTPKKTAAKPAKKSLAKPARASARKAAGKSAKRTPTSASRASRARKRTTARKTGR